jgi:hypothetical protein
MKYPLTLWRMADTLRNGITDLRELLFSGRENTVR